MHNRPLGLLTALLSGLALFSAGPAEAQDVSSVSVQPIEQGDEGPNRGNWFVLQIERGGQGTGKAAITNPADVEQDVTLEIRDLVFPTENHLGALPPQGTDTALGAWGAFDTREVRIPPGQTHIAEFVLQIPSDAEPGDHIGAVVATTTNVQAGNPVSRQIATRLYVTVPGDARRSMRIENIDVSYDFWLWPSRAIVNTELVNDGRIRLEPDVQIAGNQAEGSDILLSRSTEPYVTSIDIPWYGTILRLPVIATAEGGLVRTATATRIVFPLGLFILLVVAGSAGYAGRRWWKNRKSQTAELKQDIQRLEQLITQQAKAQESTAAVGTGLPTPTDVTDDEEAIILAALKRARRSDDDTALARIALAKHLTSGGGLDLILEALEAHEGKHREALVNAAVSYGADALSTHERFGSLPDQTQTELGERLVTAGETVSGNGNGKPAKVPQPVVGQTDSDVLRNELAKVKGVGPAKQEALVSRFGSLDAIRSAEVEDLTDVPGIGYATAREILDQLNG